MKNKAALVIGVLSLWDLALTGDDRGGKLRTQGTSIEGCPPSECDCVDGNLVANCGFETGDFTDWTLSGDQTDMEVLPAGHSGCYGAFLGPPGDMGFLAQDLPTAAGEYYDLSFWLRGMGTPNAFQVLWNGAIVYRSSQPMSQPSSSSGFSTCRTISSSMTSWSLSLPKARLSRIARQFMKAPPSSSQALLPHTPAVPTTS